MASVKPRGSQLDVASIATAIRDDPNAIAAIASGVQQVVPAYTRVIPVEASFDLTNGQNSTIDYRQSLIVCNTGVPLTVNMNPTGDQLPEYEFQIGQQFSFLLSGEGEVIFQEGWGSFVHTNSTIIGTTLGPPYVLKKQYSIVTLTALGWDGGPPNRFVWLLSGPLEEPIFLTSGVTSLWSRIDGSSSIFSEKVSDGNVYNSSTSGRLGTVTLNNVVERIYTGLIFHDIRIPQGIRILGAKIVFRGYDVRRGIFQTEDRQYLTIRGHAYDDAPSFSIPTKITGRPKTNNAVDWIPGPWGTYLFPSPDLTNIVQEIVNRPGWAPGNDMSFEFAPNSSISDRRFEIQNSSERPELQIQYTSW